jgi:hypothetical protein
MKVRDLKKLLENVDENLDVICFADEGEGFYPSVEFSGDSVFTGSCDENGNPIDDGGGDIKLFALMSGNGFEIID